MNRGTYSQNYLGKGLIHSQEIKNKANNKQQIDTKWLERIEKLNDKIIMEAFQQKQYKTALSLSNQLEAIIERQDYTTNKKNYFYHLSVCFYNRAYLFHLLDDLNDCHKNMEKAIENYEIMQGYAKNRQETVAYNGEYIKLLLQLCAVLSQNGRHKQAIAYAQKSLNKLIQCFRVLHAICYEHTLLSTETESTQSTLQSNPRSDRVDFKRIVIKQASKMLEQLSSLPSIHKLVLEDKQYYEGIMKNIYFWKDNTENNEKILRKQFDLDKGATSPRNILGVHKKSNWVEQFHIGALMSLKTKKLKLDVNTQTYYLLSSQCILQMALYCSVCYFTIATQTRFNEFELDLESLNISERYKRLHTNDTMTKCKLLHIKSLQIAAKYLPPSNFFLNHLLSSFNKNYKFLLDQIKEQSQMTMKQIRGQQNILETSIQEYGISKPENTKIEKKPLRKRSKTIDKMKSSAKGHSKNKNSNDGR